MQKKAMKNGSKGHRKLQKAIAPPARQRTATAGVEALERRVMLSISPSVFIGPINVPGTEWDYTATDAAGFTAPYVEKVIGPTIFNGVQCVAIQVQANEQDFYGFDSQGNYHFYGYQSSNGGITTVDTYTPADNDVPAQVSQGVQYSQTVIDNGVTTDSSGNTVSTTQEQEVSSESLVSETPTPFSFNGNTYDSYTIQGTSVDTPITDGTYGTPTTSSISATYAVGIGLVSAEEPMVGMLQLTSFTTAANHLAVGSVSNAAVDDSIPAIQVSIQSFAGATDTTAADAVTITASISSASTGTGTLSGTATATTSDGTATFSGLSINKPGQYVLTFTDSTGRTVSSGAFQISAGKLKFEGRVSNAVSGSSIDPAVKVELVNSKGKLITDADSLVTLSITGDPTVPITGNTAQSVNGIAEFPALKIGKPGTYTLSANDAQSDGTGLSNEIEITGLHLAFRLQPQEVGAGAALHYEIELEDSRNRLVNNSSLGLGLALIQLNSSTGVLSNIADIFNAGKATNAGSTPISIDQPGTYEIAFTPISGPDDSLGNTIDPITSAPFKVVANHLVFKEQPRNTHVNTPLRYLIEMEDFRNHLVSSADTLSFALQDVGAGSVGVLQSTTDQLVGGSANNTSNVPLQISAPGTYALTVVDIPAAPATQAAQRVTSKNFSVSAQG